MSAMCSESKPVPKDSQKFMSATSCSEERSTATRKSKSFIKRSLYQSASAMATAMEQSMLSLADSSHVAVKIEHVANTLADFASPAESRSTRKLDMKVWTNQSSFSSSVNPWALLKVQASCRRT